ncbi:MAG: putative lipoprotein [Micavibrio sp.]|nr:putative lipoprotein [Micavibrio sp.]
MKPLFFAFVLIALVIPSMAFAASADEQRAAIQKMETATLEKLYKEKPDTRREIQEAEGYAVFSNGELAVMWLSGGYGHGAAHSRDGQTIYMEMAKAGVGLGLGAKDFNTVFVFHDPDAFRKFTTTGLDLSGTADAAAKAGVKGNAASGAADVIPGVRVYQMTDNGLIAQAMVQGTKYWRDDSLNTAVNQTSH